MDMRESPDVLSVSKLVHKYFRCLDSHDAAEMADCLTEDLEAFHTLTGLLKGRDVFLNVTMREVPGLKVTQHYSTNQEILVDGDQALCLSYLFAQHVVEGGGKDLLLQGGGRYTHECVRTEAGWKIARLRNDVTWMDPGLGAVFKSQASLPLDGGG